jgi:TRAP-type mannitol/chloroaromatic compound transport system substrate-binding protein
MTPRQSRLVAGLAASALALAAQPALAAEITFRSFSTSAAIGPPADAFAAKLSEVSTTVLGPSGEVRFTKLPGIPAVPAKFGGSITAAVGAGAAAGGFDAAYTSGSDVNKTWGFLFNSGVPFGPTFDEYLGFLFGKSIDGQSSGLDLIQSILDARNRNVVAIPIVGSSEQLSGYFKAPLDDIDGERGIGISGLCTSGWTLRYLTPGENVLNQACDDLAAAGTIPAKTLKFVAPIPGGGSLVEAMQANLLQGFEFATPLDDLSQVFNTPVNPGTLGARYVHFPGWQQQFLVTWLLVNRQAWDGLSPAQQTLVKTVARDHVMSSYGENVRQQGAAMRAILEANDADGDPSNDMVLVPWPKKDQELMIQATARFLNGRVDDATLPAADRADYARVLEALRKYVRSNDIYWDDRSVRTKSRFEDWQNAAGESWTAKAAKHDHR